MTYEQKMLEQIAKQLKRIADSLEKLEYKNYCKNIPIIIDKEEFDDKTN